VGVRLPAEHDVRRQLPRRRRVQIHVRRRIDVRRDVRGELQSNVQRLVVLLDGVRGARWVRTRLHGDDVQHAMPGRQLHAHVSRRRELHDHVLRRKLHGRVQRRPDVLVRGNGLLDHAVR
jgi:hypothetical protein